MRRSNRVHMVATVAAALLVVTACTSPEPSSPALGADAICAGLGSLVEGRRALDGVEVLIARQDVEGIRGVGQTVRDHVAEARAKFAVAGPLTSDVDGWASWLDQAGVYFVTVTLPLEANLAASVTSYETTLDEVAAQARASLQDQGVDCP